MPPFEIEFDAEKHKYRIDGEPVPSVTQVLGIIDKSGPLSWWGQGIGVKGVCELRELLKDEMPWDDPEGIVKLLTTHRKTINHVKRQAGTRGSSLHQALEQYVSRGLVPNAADFPLEDVGYVKALARVLIDLKPEPIEFEQIVGSKEHSYAGKFDLLARIAGKVTRLDMKSGKGLYPEAELQLAGYELAARECEREASERLMLVRLDAAGEYEVKHAQATFEQFLAVLGAWRAVRELKATRQPVAA